MPITPDTKDWTWVLDRRCPDCGFDSARVNDDDIGRLIRANAAAWPAILVRAEARIRPNDDMWSPLEYACHVRDVFRVCDYRLARMITEEDPAYPNWDQDRTAIDDRYDEQDPGVVGAQIADSAEKIASRFESVTGDQWARPGSRSDGARFTVASLGRYVLHDPEHHLWDVGA
jgi:hypothetical protein